MYYNDIVSLFADNSQEQCLSDSLHTATTFYVYWENLRLRKVQNDVWVRAVLAQDGCLVNNSGFLRCPLQLVRSLLVRDTVTCSIIPFNIERNENGESVYGTPWNSTLYDSYSNTVTSGHVLLFDYFLDGETLSKSGKKGAMFVGISFANLHPYSETWYTVGIIPTTTSILPSLPDDWRRCLKLQLFHRFPFLLFQPLLRASFNRFIVNCITYFPHLGMVATDQPEKRLSCVRKDVNRTWVAAIVSFRHVSGLQPIQELVHVKVVRQTTVPSYKLSVEFQSWTTLNSSSTIFTANVTHQWQFDTSFLYLFIIDKFTCQVLSRLRQVSTRFVSVLTIFLQYLPLLPAWGPPRLTYTELFRLISYM